MPKDIRHFMSQVECELPGEFIRVQKPVSPRFEMTAILAKLEARGREPMVLFESAAGYSTPVLMNVHASRPRLALALGTTPDRIMEEYGRRIQKPLTPEPLRSGSAPCQEVVLLGDEVDLNRLPIPTHHEVDGGAFLAGSIVVAPTGIPGVRNCSFNRLQLCGPRELRSHLAIGRHLWNLATREEKQGRPLPVAIVTGVHPAIALGTLFLTPPDVDEYAAAGGILGESLRTVPAQTVPVDVPADAELIIEGEILPNVRRPEGPFGEFTGYAVGADDHHVFNITAVTHRRGFILQDVNPGHTEHRLMGAIPKEASILKAIRTVCPAAKAVHLPTSGAGRFHAYISIEKKSEGIPRNVLAAAFGSDLFLKLAIVVDADIDVYNEAEVMWAVANRVQADRDVIILPRMQGSELDPSCAPGGITAKMGIDATQPLSGFPPRLKIPDEVMNRIRLEDFV